MSQRSSRDSEDSQGLYETRRLKAIAARWDAKAATWDRELASPSCHLNEDEGYARFLRQALRAVKQRQDFCARHGVIDAGCGTGLVLAEVVSRFVWGIGVDISPKMIRVAEAKQLKQCRFVVGDCFQLPSLCPKAGAVLSRGVLLSHYGRHHGEALLQAVRDGLMPGGFLVFDFLNAAARSISTHAPQNKTYFEGQEACAMARHAGFGSALVLGESKRRVQLLLAELD
jgi:SAM-dependent methyltransferase